MKVVIEISKTPEKESGQNVSLFESYCNFKFLEDLLETLSSQI